MKDTICIHEFELPESGDEEPIKDTCAICQKNVATVKVKYSTHTELICMECYSAPDYQVILKRDKPEVFEIKY